MNSKDAYIDFNPQKLQNNAWPVMGVVKCGWQNPHHMASGTHQVCEEKRAMSRETDEKHSKARSVRRKIGERKDSNDISPFSSTHIPS